MSWTGSENQRREQGACKPPVFAPDKSARWCVPAGVMAYIRRVEDFVWRHFRTTREYESNQIEEKTRDHFVFREQGYQLKVNRRFVIDRFKH